MNADDTVRSYKKHSAIEQGWRKFKMQDLHVRPIGHRLERRARSHIFGCMLIYYETF